MRVSNLHHAFSSSSPFQPLQLLPFLGVKTSTIPNHHSKLPNRSSTFFQRQCLQSEQLQFRRPFSTTSTLLKKKQQNSDHQSQPSPSTNSSSGGNNNNTTRAAPAPTPNDPSRLYGQASSFPDDPYDFSLLERGTQAALAHLREELSGLRTGGRVSPSTIEGLKVTLARRKEGSGEKGSEQNRAGVVVKAKGRRERERFPRAGGEGAAVFKLGDLAQVIPRQGRAMVVMVGEAEHVKPITATILASPHSLAVTTPQPSAPQELHIPLPPPTAESRAQVHAAMQKEGEKATNGVREARAALQKRLRALKLEGRARPDALHKAGEKMEKVVEKANAEVKKVVETARKALE